MNSARAVTGVQAETCPAEVTFQNEMVLTCPL